ATGSPKLRPTEASRDGGTRRGCDRLARGRARHGAVEKCRKRLHQPPKRARSTCAWTLLAALRGKVSTNSTRRGRLNPARRVAAPDRDDHVRVHATDGALAVEDRRAARHGNAVGRLGLAVRLDELRAVEQPRKRTLRVHRRRRTADGDLLDGPAHGAWNLAE